MGIGSAFILLFLFVSGRISTFSGLSLPHLGWVFITALLLFGYVITWYSGLRYLKASVATSVLLLGGPITALLTALTSGFVLSPTQIIGTLFLIGGVVVIGRLNELVRA